MLKIRTLFATIIGITICGCAIESFGLHYSEDLTLSPNESTYYEPVGVAISKDYIFIKDSFRILVTDLYGNYVKTIEIPNYSTGIAISENLMFVSDEAHGVVNIFDLDGMQMGTIGDKHPEGVTYMDRFGTKGLGLGQYQFASPTKLAVNNDNLFIVEEYFGKIKIFDLNGVYVDEFHTFNKYPDLTPIYDDPLDVAVNSTHVFIADNWQEEVHIVSTSGTNHTRELADVITVPGAAAVAVNDNNIFVSAEGDIIKIFKMDGTYVTALRGCDANDEYLKESLWITYIDIPKLLNKTLQPAGFITVAPMGIAVQDNHLVLVNWHKDVTQIFDSQCLYKLSGSTTTTTTTLPPLPDSYTDTTFITSPIHWSWPQIGVVAILAALVAIIILYVQQKQKKNTHT